MTGASAGVETNCACVSCARICSGRKVVIAGPTGRPLTKVLAGTAVSAAGLLALMYVTRLTLVTLLMMVLLTVTLLTTTVRLMLVT